MVETGIEEMNNGFQKLRHWYVYHPWFPLCIFLILMVAMGMTALGATAGRNDLFGNMFCVMAFVQIINILLMGFVGLYHACRKRLRLMIGYWTEAFILFGVLMFFLVGFSFVFR